MTNFYYLTVRALGVIVKSSKRKNLRKKEKQFIRFIPFNKLDFEKNMFNRKTLITISVVEGVELLSARSLQGPGHVSPPENPTLRKPTISKVAIT